MKNLKIVFLILIINWGKYYCQSIFGSNYVKYGVASSVYSIQSLPGTSHSYFWFSNCSDVSFTNGGASSTSINIPATSNCCSFNITCLYSYLDTTQSPAALMNISYNKTIMMIPILKARVGSISISTISPNNTFQVYAQFGNTNNLGQTWCSSTICPSQSYLWSVSSGVVCTGCTSNSNPITINVPMNVNLSQINIGCSLQCASNSGAALSGLSIPIKLDSPSLTGPTNIGCNSTTYLASNTVLYNAATLYANSYTWNYPTNIFAPSSQNISTLGSFIYLDVIGIGSGNVSVQAVSSNLVQPSSVTTLPFNICCFPFKNIGGIVNSSNSPYNQEAGSVLTTNNDIQSNASVILHASSEVKLLPGFNAVSNSQVHIYNAICGSGYLPRATNVLQNEQFLPTDIIDSTFIRNSHSQENKMKLVTHVDKYNQSGNTIILPNPCNGIFKLTFDTNKSLPRSIAIFNTNGVLLLEITEVKKFETEINIENYVDGMYLVRINFDSFFETKKIIKNNY